MRRSLNAIVSHASTGNMSPALNHLLVYGTLCPALPHKTTGWLKQNARLVGRVSFPGKLYALNHYPGAIRHWGNRWQRVHGQLYRLAKPQRSLLVLDDYEECSPQFKQPHE